MALTKVGKEGITGVSNASDATAITIDSSENVGIGVSSPQELLHLKDGDIVVGNGTASNSSSIGKIGFSTDASNSRFIGIESFRGGDAANADLRFHTYGGDSDKGERMRINTAGNLLVGATSGDRHIISKSAASGQMLEIINSNATAPSGAAFKLTGAAPNNGTQTFFTTADSSAYRGGWLSNGGVQNYQANNSNLSDRREKTNFSPAKSYLNTICNIPVQTFNYIDQDMEDDDSVSLGVVAQDVQENAPELVVESNWGTEDEPKMRLSVYQTDLQYALMKCIQEQQVIIEALEARLTAGGL